MKKILAFLLAAAAAALMAGCKSGMPSPANPVTLTMWHNYGGDMQQTMDELIDEFNTTEGKKQGIIINVEAISSSAELNESLSMIINGDPGAPDMPDICTAYPKIAVMLYQKELLANMDGYFSEKELSEYIPEFISEGRLGDGGLYVFPNAKSTEILYLNQTLFDRFAADTGATEDMLRTFEGISELSQIYYEWTDARTPQKNDGKAFYAADSWFNLAEVGMVQKGGSIFDDSGTISLLGDYEHIFRTIYEPAVKGGIAIYDGYSSDLSKTGDLVCSTGSSAGILFYGDTITYENNVVEEVEYNILPYPVFKGGSKTALQRGGGFMIAKSEQKREYAAAAFIKWLTAPEQNMKFVSSTGYLPVTVKAFEQDVPEMMEGADDARIKKMLEAVMSMYSEYSFFTAPNYADLDTASKEYEADFKAIMADEREKYLNGQHVSSDTALLEIQNKYV